MKISFFPFNHLIYIFCLLCFCGLSLYGQQTDPALHFVDSMNQIINSKPAGSKAQLVVMEELRARLTQMLSKPSTFEQRYIVAGLMQELDLKIKPQKVRIIQQTNIISNEVMILEKQLKKWQDSIVQVQQSLKKIIEDDEQNRVTREMAVFTLAKIHDTKVLDYLFDNEEKLQFTEMHPEDNEAWEQQMSRTTMVAIDREYYYKESTESEKWLLMKYLLHDLKQYGFREVVLVNYLLTLPERVKSPQLLLEFMYANADPGSKETLEFFRNLKSMQKD